MGILTLYAQVGPLLTESMLKQGGILGVVIVALVVVVVAQDRDRRAREKAQSDKLDAAHKSIEALQNERSLAQKSHADALSELAQGHQTELIAMQKSHAEVTAVREKQHQAELSSLHAARVADQQSFVESFVKLSQTTTQAMHSMEQAVRDHTKLVIQLQAVMERVDESLGADRKIRR